MIGRGLRFQSLAGLILAGVLLAAVGPVAAYSSLFGSLAAFIPALIFSILVASKFGNDSAVFLRAAVMGEAAKLLVTALICMAVFLWVKPLAAGWFFAGMITAIFIGYLGLILSD
jgi:ATP synthase protein I